MTDTPEMVERVARAILRHELSEMASAGLFEREWARADVRSAYTGRAHAAIEAMREPTDEMLEYGWGQGGAPEDIWPAMIDTALGQPPSRD